MKSAQSLAKGTFLLGLIMLASACVVREVPPPHEGYYDSDHHRYYHEHAWHECGDRDDYCRDR
jgi:hypothetical protein